ncbi:MAG: MAE_28990/MAE_18760 family HEPN-like nuclease [Isosphaeraceae bacterium]
MKISTPAQVARRLDRSLAWRKKELTQQKLLADSASAGNAEVLRRSGITLLYAHWEGFIKDASNTYLLYIGNQPIELTLLRPCFVAIALGSEIRVAGQAKKTSIHSKLVELFRTIDSPPPLRRRVPWKNVIATHSNLKSTVLREITATLGLDYAPFELKEKAVIDRLVKFRNSVAHGVGQPILQADYDTLHVETIGLLDQFRDLVEDAAFNNSHLR